RLRGQPQGAEGGAVLGTDKDQVGDVTIARVVAALQVRAGRRDVIHQEGPVARLEVAQVDRVRRLATDRLVLDQVPVDGVLPEIGADAVAIAVPAEIETEDGEALLGQLVGQQVPAFLVAALAAEFVQQKNARRSATLAAGPVGAVQFYFIDGLKMNALGLLLVLVGLGAGPGEATGRNKTGRQSEENRGGDPSHVQTLRRVMGR